MIVELPDTTTSQVSKTLVKIREEGGVVALGRVLTLVIATSPGGEEEAIEAANDASREHPMRVIVVSSDPDELPDADARLDAEIRVGGDAGASEVIVLRACGDAARDEESLVMGLLLPDAPVVTWWPGVAPAVPAESPLGRIAQRRITDASTQRRPAGCAARVHGELPARRRGLRLDAADALAGAARRGARPAAVRARHGSPGHGSDRLAVDHAARGVAAPAARCPDDVRAHAGRAGLARHPRRAPRARRRRRSSSSATCPASPPCASRASRPTTWHSPAATSATASPTNSAASTPMSCTVR